MFVAAPVAWPNRTLYTHHDLFAVSCSSNATDATDGIPPADTYQQWTKEGRQRAVCAVKHAGLGLPGALYLTSNDGTLMSGEQAQRLPLHTFQSGPVNSLRGAAKLSGLSGVAHSTTLAGLLVSSCLERTAAGSE